MVWQKETCETCLFRDDRICRRMPPSVVMLKERPLAYYPLVKEREIKETEGYAVDQSPDTFRFLPACAEYKPSDSTRN